MNRVAGPLDARRISYAFLVSRPKQSFGDQTRSDTVSNIRSKPECRNDSCCDCINSLVFLLFTDCSFVYRVGLNSVIAQALYLVISVVGTGPFYLERVFLAAGDTFMYVV